MKSKKWTKSEHFEKSNSSTYFCQKKVALPMEIFGCLDDISLII